MSSTSQDTHAQAPKGSVCDPVQYLKAQAEALAADGKFLKDGAPDAVALLEHFLGGTGTPVNFPDKSTPSKDLLKNANFNKLNRNVLAEIEQKLNGGATMVNLGSDVLQRIPLYQPADLADSFGGTQGLVVTGSGSLSGGEFIGTLTYKIEDSYGFSTSDVFYAGVGKSMRYLQTVCGNPPHRGGAHWFSDSITITVHFKLQSLLA
jgi:hypothetical protein